MEERDHTECYREHEFLGRDMLSFSVWIWIFVAVNLLLLSSISFFPGGNPEWIYHLFWAPLYISVPLYLMGFCLAVEDKGYSRKWWLLAPLVPVALIFIFYVRPKKA